MEFVAKIVPFNLGAKLVDFSFSSFRRIRKRLEVAIRLLDAQRQKNREEVGKAEARFRALVREKERENADLSTKIDQARTFEQNLAEIMGE